MLSEKFIFIVKYVSCIQGTTPVRRFWDSGIIRQDHVWVFVQPRRFTTWFPEIMASKAWEKLVNSCVFNLFKFWESGFGILGEIAWICSEPFQQRFLYLPQVLMTWFWKMLRFPPKSWMVTHSRNRPLPSEGSIPVGPSRSFSNQPWGKDHGIYLI